MAPTHSVREVVVSSNPPDHTAIPIPQERGPQDTKHRKSSHHKTFGEVVTDAMDAQRTTEHRRTRSNSSRYLSPLKELKNVHLRDIAHGMPQKVIQTIKPTRIPFVKRAIKWCKQKWYAHVVKYTRK